MTDGEQERVDDEAVLRGAPGSPDLATGTALGWHLLVALVVTWLVFGPLNDPPPAPGLDGSARMSELSSGPELVLLILAAPVVVVGMAVSAGLCHACRHTPAGPAALVRRGTWTFAVGLLSGFGALALGVALLSGLVSADV